MIENRTKYTLIEQDISDVRKKASDKLNLLKKCMTLLECKSFRY